MVERLADPVGVGRPPLGPPLDGRRAFDGVTEVRQALLHRRASVAKRPKLSDPARGTRELQTTTLCRVRCSAWLANKVSSFIILPIFIEPQSSQDAIWIASATSGPLSDECVQTGNQVRLTGEQLNHKTMPFVLDALHGCCGAEMELEEGAATLVANASSRPHITIKRVVRRPL